MKPELSPLQLRALNLLLQGETVTETARQLDVHRSTVHDWSRNNPLFIMAFHVARQRHQADILDRYHTLAAPALDLVGNLIGDQSAPIAIRLRAALAVLKSVESTELAVAFSPEQETEVNAVATTHA